MEKYSVFYKKNPTFWEDENLTKDNFRKTHVFLMKVDANSLDDVFLMMQGDVWSPNGEARDFIRGKGLKHTSMSVGDVICELKSENYYEVALEGFNLLK